MIKDENDALKEAHCIWSNSASKRISERREKKRKIQYIKKHFDLKGLKKAGFLDTITDFEKIEKRIVMFFGLPSIFDYAEIDKTGLYKKSK